MKASGGRDLKAGVVLGAGAFLLAILFTAASDMVRRVDFSAFYTTGLMEEQGNSAKIYDPAERAAAQVNFLNATGMVVNPYPPFQALLFAPLARLSYRAAYVVWGMTNILLWICFHYALLTHSGAKLQPLRFLALSSLFFPLWIAMLQGQFSVVVLFSFTLTFLLLKRCRDGMAGLALGLGLLKFQVVLPFALILLLRRRWRFIGGLAVAAGVLGIASLAAVGPSGVISYARLLVDTFVHPWNPAYAVIKPWNMTTVRGFITGLLSGRIRDRWVSASAIVLSGCLILYAAQAWNKVEGERGKRTNPDLMFAAALVVSLVTAPHLYPHDLTPMLLAIILLVGSPQWQTKSKERQILAVAISILYASPLYLPELVKREVLWIIAPVVATFALATISLARRPTLEPDSRESDTSRFLRSQEALRATNPTGF